MTEFIAEIFIHLFIFFNDLKMWLVFKCIHIL